jgi:hypothetical protein
LWTFDRECHWLQNSSRMLNDACSQYLFFVVSALVPSGADKSPAVPPPR